MVTAVARRGHVGLFENSLPLRIRLGTRRNASDTPVKLGKCPLSGPSAHQKSGFRSDWIPLVGISLFFLLLTTGRVGSLKDLVGRRAVGLVGAVSLVGSAVLSVCTSFQLGC